MTIEDLSIFQYRNSDEKRWDTFIETESYNGTFLQSRKFLNYHPQNRFIDHSLLIWKGNTLVAVIPAAVVMEKDIATLASHPGSTFGGIVFNKEFYNLQHVEAVLECVERYALSNSLKKLRFSQPSNIFTTANNDLLEYFYFQRGYKQYEEISFVIDLNNYNNDILSNFSRSRRRGYQIGAKSGLLFRQLHSDNEIQLFYNLLVENLQKFNAKPVHTYDEILDLFHNRIPDNIEFYGCYYQDKLVSGSMVFIFNEGVFHTQYLAASQSHLNLFPNNYMDGNMIHIAKERGMRYFSFGISTENHGQILNRQLAQFKEGFGTTYSINRTFFKKLE